MITDRQRKILTAFAMALVDQDRARVIVEPARRGYGYWFGGGNLIEGPDGAFYLAGRHRASGDSRTGVGAGRRGFELALYRSDDRGRSFSKTLSFSKTDLQVGMNEVISIEGAALNWNGQAYELFISTEKKKSYPHEVATFQKPGTGVWSIDYLQAETIEGLAQARIQTILECTDPQFLHVKDPFIYHRSNGDLLLGFVTHPYNWSSSNAGYALRPVGQPYFNQPVYEFFPRGVTWDVATTRLTAWLRVPQAGVLQSAPPLTLLFYDGAESMRKLEEHEHAVNRPRGFACEEIGGVAVAQEDGVSLIQRLSINFPLFTSKYGTGCSRYVDVLETREGYYVTWQQSQADYSQPLVMNFLSREETERILSNNQPSSPI